MRKLRFSSRLPYLAGLPCLACVPYLLTLAVCLASLGGCIRVRDVPATVDQMMFQRVGGTVFSTPEPLTMKEIHLDNGTLSGREIIVQGNVIETSQYYTYLVLSDDTARMLVVLTNLESAGPLLKSQKPKTLRILGTVENGKKGLPYIMARSLNVVSEPGKA